MYTVGVIPAAGSGSRWGGYFKELLPCGSGEWLLDRCIMTMRHGGANAVVLVTNEEKIGTHANHLRKTAVPVYYAIQQGKNDIWSAIEESFAFEADQYLFAMPDTYIPLDAFKNRNGHNFGMGLFQTNRSDRFGVFRDGRVVNKEIAPPGLHEAWGVMAWSRRVVKYWQLVAPADYTDAINLAIGSYRLHTWRLDYYYDMATFEDYQEMLNGDIF